MHIERHHDAFPKWSECSQIYSFKATDKYPFSKSVFPVMKFLTYFTRHDGRSSYITESSVSKRLYITFAGFMTDILCLVNLISNA